MHFVTLAMVVIKIATLMPEGSAWLKLMKKWTGAVEQRTGGRVQIKLYPGGSQGDEKDMLRKVKLGTLAGAAITAIGLSAITPEVRVLEVCRDYDELDHARSKLDKMLRRSFENHGFVLVGWGDVGPVHLFSKKPIRSLEEMQTVKMWLFNDDAITRRGFEALGLHGSPLSIPEVQPALSTGMIDTYIGSPLSTLALQWYTHSKYMTSSVLGQATGAVVMGKKQWEELSAADRQTMLDEGRKLEDEMKTQVRADNAKAWNTLKERGIEVVQISKEFERDLMLRMSRVALENMDLVLATAGNTSKDFQIAVRNLLEESRHKYPGLGDVLDEYDRRQGSDKQAQKVGKGR